MPDKGVTSSGGKTFGEGTRLTLNVKTLTWILGILVIIFGYFYIDMRSKLKDANASIDKKVDEEMIQYRDVLYEVKSDVKSVEGKINNMEVNIGILLDRSSGNRTSGTSDVNPSENIPTPLSTDTTGIP